MPARKPPAPEAGEGKPKATRAPAKKPTTKKPVTKKPAAKAAPKALVAEEPAKLGRPSLYRPEYGGMLVEYFNIEPTREVTRQVVTKSGDVVEMTQTVPNDLPTLAGFCCKIGVHRETLLNWSKAHPEFFDALKHAKEHQERILVANGITGFYDKTFAIFTAKNLINWRDKTEVEHDLSDPLKDLLTKVAGGSLKASQHPDDDD